MNNPNHPSDDDSLAAVSAEFRKSMQAFLLDQVRHQNDFPALSESIRTINQIASSDEESIASLSNTILKDFALTNKLLKLVNSAPYRHYGGGNISTVSRAVSILGFDGVKNVALALLLFDHTQSRRVAHLKDEFLRALFSGVLAREVSRRTLARGTEEAFVCSMFHHLGRLLAMFYFSAEDRETHRLMIQRHLDENTASAQVLGLSYCELGMAVARDWCFPEQIIHSMEELPDGPVQKPASNMDKLRLLAVFANELCETIAHTDCEQMPENVRDIIEKFAEGLPLTEKQLLAAVEKTMDEVIQYANIIQINLQKIPFGRRISQTEENGEIHNARGCAITPDEPENPWDANEALGASQHILTGGIRDISDALVEESPLNNTLHVILETLYRGLKFQHILLCTVDAQHNSVSARFGFGPDIETLIQNFSFHLTGEADVFQTAITTGVSSVIANTEHPRIQKQIPEWYRAASGAQTFVLFPLNIHEEPVALIYADKPDPGAIHFSENERSLIQTLRNQALLAIRQSL